MHNQNGFTLLELLIAAVIIGALAVFATQTFRQMSSQTRVEDAKARAKVLAMSARRFLLDYPAAAGNVFRPDNSERYLIGTVGPVTTTSVCVHNELSAQILVNCGYLEYQQYTSEWRDKDAQDAYKTNFSMWFEVNGVATGRVCFQRASTRIQDAHVYCTDGETVSVMD